MSLNFEVLASSSAGCAYRLSGGGSKSPLLIECGLPFKQLQKALDFKVSELCGCLASHSHKDHCKAVKELMAAGILIFASSQTWSQLGYEKLPYRGHRFETGVVRVCEDWDILPFEAVHDCEGTLGFIIGSPDGDRLLYLTDSAYSKFKFEGLTMLAVECNHSVKIMRANVVAGIIDKAQYERTLATHMSIERLLDMLKSNDLTKVQAIHLLHLSDRNSDAIAFKDAIEAATGIPCKIAAKKGSAV